MGIETDRGENVSRENENIDESEEQEGESGTTEGGREDQEQENDDVQPNDGGKEGLMDTRRKQSVRKNKARANKRRRQTVETGMEEINEGAIVEI